jgi:hypothetical protein
MAGGNFIQATRSFHLGEHRIYKNDIFIVEEYASGNSRYATITASWDHTIIGEYLLGEVDEYFRPCPCPVYEYSYDAGRVVMIEKNTYISTDGKSHYNPSPYNKYKINRGTRCIIIDSETSGSRTKLHLEVINSPDVRFWMDHFQVHVLPPLQRNPRETLLDDEEPPSVP